jgi:Tfp pilus assembly protein PilN
VKAVNLSPTEQGAAPKASPAGGAPKPSGGEAFGAYAVLGALAFAVVAVALMVLTGNSIKDNKAKLAGVQQELTATQAQAAALQSFADFKQLSEARVATVRGLAASRFAWAQTLDDISRALPSDVYVKSLDGTTSGAGGGSSIRGALTAPAVEVTGCTSSQSSVARMMSALRSVRGATRVSLATSDVQETTSTGIAPSTLTGSAAPGSSVTEPCPKGSPPDFDVVVFFERAAVPAAAAPNGVIAGPTGATGAVSGPSGAAGATEPTSASSIPTTP